MLQKTISFICDGCGCAINHYTGYTRREAIATIKDDDSSIVIKGSRHFCDEKCYKAYKTAKEGK